MDARACKPLGQTAHTVIASMQATDHTPPTLPAIPEPQFHFSTDKSNVGCGGPECPDLAVIEIKAVATDDMTPPSQIGYRFTLVSGKPPVEFTFPTLPIDPNASDAPMPTAGPLTAATTGFSSRRTPAMIGW